MSVHAPRHATVDDEDLPGERVGSAERDDLRRDVVAAGNAAEYGLTPRCLSDGFRESLRHSRAFYETRRDAIDRHVRGERHRKATSQVNQPRLARRIRDAAAHRIESADGGDVDDPTGSTCAKVWSEGSGEQERPAQIGFE